MYQKGELQQLLADAGAAAAKRHRPRPGPRSASTALRPRLARRRLPCASCGARSTASSYMAAKPVADRAEQRRPCARRRRSPNAPRPSPTRGPAAVDRARQHRLAERDAAERRGVEARERVERVALDVRARHRGIQEAEVEERVVPDEHRARAAARRAPPCGSRGRAACSASFSGIAGRSGWCGSMPFTASEAGSMPRAVERLHVIAVRGCPARSSPIGVISISTAAISSSASVCAVEAAGLDVDGDREEAAEAVDDARLDEFVLAHHCVTTRQLERRRRRATARVASFAERVVPRHAPGWRASVIVPSLRGRP